MNGITGLPATMNPAVGGDASVPPQEVRRPPVERVERVERVEEPPAKSGGGGMSQEGLEKMVKDANQSLSAMTSLRISLDLDSNKMVVRVVDQANNNKVIRQIPSEDVMNLAKRIDALKELKGFFLDAKA